MLKESIPETTRERLRRQLDALPLILASAKPGALSARPPNGKWSALENLAHLARHHDVFLGRLERMLAEARPDLGRYRAESDADWPNWAALGLEDVLARLRRLRATLVERVEAMTPEQAARTGVHPVLGEMAIPLWLEFFLLHEAHHLYVVLGLVRR